MLLSIAGIEKVEPPGARLKEIPVTLKLDVPLQPATHQVYTLSYVMNSKLAYMEAYHFIAKE